MFLYAALASPSFKLQTSIARDCSFNLLWLAVATSISLIIPGGVTYATGSRFPFSSTFTAEILKLVDEGSPGSISCSPAKDSSYFLHSPLTSSIRANRRVTGCCHPFMKTLINLMERKSEILPTRFWYSRTGILNWYHLIGFCSLEVALCDKVSKTSVM